jgi:hypothetical protein
MNLFHRLRILPQPNCRFGFWRTVTLWLLLSAIFAFLLKADGRTVSSETPLTLVGLVLAIPGLLVPLFWNRRAVKAGAPGFVTAWREHAFAVVSIPTALALLWAVESWRGAKAWKAAQDSIRARGEPISFQELLGPEVPAEQNFAESPLMAGLHRYVKTNDAKGRVTFKWVGRTRSREIQDNLRLPEPSRPNPKRPEKLLHRTGYDLSALASVLRSGTNSYKTTVEDPATGVSTEVTLPYNLPRPPADVSDAHAVLIALEGRRGVMDQIREASKRPYCRFAIRYEDGPNTLLPHLWMHQRMANLFRIRSAARIHTGDLAGAEEDIQTIFRLGALFHRETTLIGHSVRMAVETIGFASFWEGCVAHAWTEPQLIEFQKRFEGLKQRDALAIGFRGERLLGAATMEFLLHDRLQFDRLLRNTSEPESVYAMFIPKAWVRQNQALHSLKLDQATAAVQAADETRCVSSQSAAGIINNALLRENRGFRPYRVLFDLMDPSLTKISRRSDRLLTATRLAAAVCALERFRIATGSYPKTLTELTPRFAATTPSDPMDGQPLRYRVNTDGSFTLYSIGVNQKDDGGVSEYRMGEQELLDWVWPPAAPAKEFRLF